MIVAIIQARMSSSRLPGKCLADISGRPLIDHVVARARAIEQVERVAVATTVSASDDQLVRHLRSEGLEDVYRGSEDDVLDRYFQCAKGLQADVVVRITADDPLKDPGVMTRAVEMLLADPGLDYCSNTL